MPGAMPAFVGVVLVCGAAGHYIIIMYRASFFSPQAGREISAPPVSSARFAIGDVVRHRMFGFRGVVFDIDPVFANSEEWYESIPADLRPVRDQPFYHLLAEMTKAATSPMSASRTCWPMPMPARSIILRSTRCSKALPMVATG